MSNLQLIAALLFILVLLGFPAMLRVCFGDSIEMAPVPQFIVETITFVLFILAFAITLQVAPHVWRIL